MTSATPRTEGTKVGKTLTYGSARKLPWILLKKENAKRDFCDFGCVGANYSTFTE
jgi:hypothetical protein